MSTIVKIFKVIIGIFLALVAISFIGTAIVSHDAKKNNTNVSNVAESVISESSLSNYNIKDNSNNNDIALDGPFLVKKVVDGDTLKVYDNNGKVFTVRLIGVNTPESVHADQSKNVPEGTIASDFTKETIKNSKYVYLEYDEGRYDKYDRTLAYVYLDDESSLNELLLEKGYAKTMFVSPNYKYKTKYISIENNAKENGVGFWSDQYSIWK